VEIVLFAGAGVVLVLLDRVVAGIVVAMCGIDL
jgi:hypothetical protein